MAQNHRCQHTRSIRRRRNRPARILFSNSDNRLQFGVKEMSQFYAKAEDEERCLQSSIRQQPVMVQGLATEGKLRPFCGIVEAVEKGHTQYADYPLRITMK